MPRCTKANSSVRLPRGIIISSTKVSRVRAQHSSCDEKISRNRYNLPVRRLLSIIFLFLFSVQLISPVLALAASSDANLLACCRRNGAHHCIMKMQQAESSGPGISLSAIPQRCPAYPALIPSVRHGDLSFHVASLIFAEIVSHPAVKTQTQARARVALDRSRQKRGPPTDLL
jgi:hypothetical protein